MGVAGGVVPRLRKRLAFVTEHRHALRRPLAGLGRDAIVATLLVGFAFAVSLPILAMEVASAVHGRIEA